MTKRELINALRGVPDNAQVYVKHTHDDAYGPIVRKFSSETTGRDVDTVVLFPDADDHVSVDYLKEVQ